MHEPEPLCIAEGVLVEFEGIEEIPAYSLTDVKVIDMASGNYVEDCMDVFKEVLPVYLQFPLVLPSPNFPVSPAHPTSLSCLL